MNVKVKKILRSALIFAVKMFGTTVLAAVVVALFALSLGMVCYAFMTDKPWYSALLIIFGSCVFYISYCLAETPPVPSFWRQLTQTPRD